MLYCVSSGVYKNRGCNLSGSERIPKDNNPHHSVYNVATRNVLTITRAWNEAKRWYFLVSRQLFLL